MGNILAHASISAHVIAQLSKVRSEDFMYLELGNFLTDVHQVRDPVAYLSAKKYVKAGSIAIAVGYIPFRRLPAWADEVFGTAGAGTRHGKLAQFLTHLVRFITHCAFAQDSVFSAAIWAEGLAKQLPVTPLTPQEVDRVFEMAFQQYYPHEHLDFPPYHHQPIEQDVGGLIRYLTEQLEYVAERLTQLERSWMLNRNKDQSDQARRDTLVMLGRALHAVEDYYFHSNFMEIFHWNRLRTFHRKDPRLPEDYSYLLKEGLTATPYALGGGGKGEIELHRRYTRRLRYPLLTRGKPSQSDSGDASGLVYTGGFARTDVFHTVMRALAGFEDLLDSAVQRGGAVGEHAQRVKETDLVLFRLILNEAERQKMLTDVKYAYRLVEEHHLQLRDRVYRMRVDEARKKGLFTARGADALMAAFELDRQLTDKYRIAGGVPPGIGGMLIILLALAQHEANVSATRVSQLNRDKNSALGLATSNGASAEQVGTHSLIAKDGGRAQPFYSEALGLAQHASASIALLLASRANEPRPNTTVALNWKTIVRHYARFPNPRANSWENSVLKEVLRNKPVPDVSEIPDPAPINYVPLTLQRIRQANKTKELEERYQQLER